MDGESEKPARYEIPRPSKKFLGRSSSRSMKGPLAGGAGAGALVLGFAVSFVLAFLLRGDWPVMAEEVHQPIAFNHRVHVEDEGMECLECHRHYETETFSGLPTAKFCALCHLEPQGESQAELDLADLLQAGAPLDWKPLFEQPPHVYYSHARHVTVAGIECADCHPGIGTSESPPVHAVPLGMDACMDCHRESGASLECTACHR